MGRTHFWMKSHYNDPAEALRILGHDDVAAAAYTWAGEAMVMRIRRIQGANRFALVSARGDKTEQTVTFRDVTELRSMLPECADESAEGYEDARYSLLVSFVANAGTRVECAVLRERTACPSCGAAWISKENTGDVRSVQIAGADEIACGSCLQRFPIAHDL